MSDSSSFANDWEAVRTAVGSVLVGQDDVVEGVLTALFAGGHVLLEGVPGLGKTLLVRTLGAALGLDFRRIQFTPDLMPADVTGTTVVEETEQGRSLVFRRGPVFTQLLLADEINRATPKTQSAMLEAMQERSVTVGGVTHELPAPFMVMATVSAVIWMKSNSIEVSAVTIAGRASPLRGAVRGAVPHTPACNFN